MTAIPNVTTTFLESSYRQLYPNIYNDLAKFAKKKTPKYVPPLKTVATLRAILLEDQIIESGSGENIVAFNHASEGLNGNHFDPATHTWRPPEGSVNIVIFSPYKNLFVFKNGVKIPFAGLPYNFYIADYSNGSDAFDIRVQDLANGNFQVYADASLWVGYVYEGVTIK